MTRPISERSVILLLRLDWSVDEVLDYYFEEGAKAPEGVRQYVQGWFDKVQEATAARDERIAGMYGRDR